MISLTRAWYACKPACISAIAATMLIGPVPALAGTRITAVSRSPLLVAGLVGGAVHRERASNLDLASNGTRWIERGIGSSYGAWHTARSSAPQLESGLLWTLRHADSARSPAIAIAGRAETEVDTTPGHDDAGATDAASLIEELLGLLAFVIWLFAGLLLMSQCQSDGLDARYS